MNGSEQHISDDLLIYLRLLAGEAPERDRYFDVRWAAGANRMGRQFISASRVLDAARLITRLAPATDVYVGVALRHGRRTGGKSAISGSHLLYIECDDPNAADRVAGVPCPPTLEVASGTPNHRHLYWHLHEPAASLQVESANRRLAVALHGDPACVDIARILRPPDTLNHKHDPPRPVRLLAHRIRARYTLAALTSALPADPRRADTNRAAVPRRRAARTRLERELLAIPAAEYARVLADIAPDRAGKALCPFHDDSRPSLQLYPDGSFYCFGCGRGGTIFDFAAASWLSGTRGQDFLELRRRLARAFDLTRQASGHPR